MFHISKILQKIDEKVSSGSYNLISIFCYLHGKSSILLDT